MMANIGEATVKVNLEMTETSKALIHDLVMEVLQEGLADDTQNPLKAFVRKEAMRSITEAIRASMGKDGKK